MSDHHSRRGTYEGYAQGPGLEGGPTGRVEGRISILRGKIRFEGQEAGADTRSENPVEIALADTALRLGGAGDDLIFFADANEPRRTLYTSDRSVLLDPEIQRDPRLAAQARRIRRTRWLGRSFFIAIPLLLLLALLVLWFSRGLLVGAVVDRVPHSWERNLGEALAGPLIDSRRVDDPNLQEATRRLAAPLRRAMARSEEGAHDIVVTLVRDETINAFAIPGGFVALHSGLVLEAESIAEIQGVLAHEVAHVELRHSLRQLVDAAGLALFVQALFGDLSGLAALAIDGGRELLSLEHSRDAEREADDRAIELLVEAGLDPTGLPRFLQRIRDAGTDLPRALTFISSHPNSQERIDRLAATTGSSRPSADPSTELTRLQTEMRRVLDL